jgi:hypothetical protein
VTDELSFCVAVGIWRPYCALSRNAPLLLRPQTYPLQCKPILNAPRVPPNLQRSKTKLEYCVFESNVLRHLQELSVQHRTCAEQAVPEDGCSKLLWKVGTETNMIIVIFWDATPCNVVYKYRHCRWTLVLAYHTTQHCFPEHLVTAMRISKLSREGHFSYNKVLYMYLYNTSHHSFGQWQGCSCSTLTSTMFPSRSDFALPFLSLYKITTNRLGPH